MPKQKEIMKHINSCILDTLPPVILSLITLLTAQRPQQQQRPQRQHPRKC